ncbi:MAG: MGMT family protein, partial [Acidobacteria bacterium]|nr:MGMT family protein [Acidobacteriota bacterium]
MGHADVRPENFTDAVEAVVSSLGSGEIMTYGEVAAEAGFDGAARAVGQVLARGEELPWWRIVNA